MKRVIQKYVSMQINTFLGMLRAHLLCSTNVFACQYYSFNLFISSEIFELRIYKNHKTSPTNYIIITPTDNSLLRIVLYLYYLKKAYCWNSVPMIELRLARLKTNNIRIRICQLEA